VLSSEDQKLKERLGYIIHIVLKYLETKKFW
jgi:hypothetical protein